MRFFSVARDWNARYILSWKENVTAWSTNILRVVKIRLRAATFCRESERKERNEKCYSNLGAHDSHRISSINFVLNWVGHHWRRRIKLNFFSSTFHLHTSFIDSYIFAEWRYCIIGGALMIFYIISNRSSNCNGGKKIRVWASESVEGYSGTFAPINSIAIECSWADDNHTRPWVLTFTDTRTHDLPVHLKLTITR
jgi:hypothetical protein